MGTLKIVLVSSLTLVFTGCSSDADTGTPNGSGSGVADSSANGSGGGTGGTGASGNAGGSKGVSGSGGTTDLDAGPVRGHVTYRIAEEDIYLLEATPGSKPRNLSDALDAISAGRDSNVNISPDGAWIAFVTTRFGCDGWECVVVSDIGLVQPSVVMVDGEAIHAGEMAIGSGGDVLVVADRGQNHETDLFVMNRTGKAWSKPKLITAESPFQYNSYPALAKDNASVLFDCSPTPYGGVGTHLCEVELNGTGFRVRVSPSDSPNGQSAAAAHSGDYAPDGSIVFEADWGSEQIWRLAPGASTPTLIGSFTNDNTPCVLPDGRVVSLWLDGPNNPRGLHELKIMNPDGSGHVVMVEGADLLDRTVGCGE